MRKLVDWFEARRDLGFELLRIYLGIGLFAKGVVFASDETAMTSMLAGGRLDGLAATIAHYVIGAHLVGGLLLAAGLMTRIAAAVNVPILLGAVLFVHNQDGLFTRSQNLEFTLFVLFTLLLVLASGPGRWAIDTHLFKKPAGSVRDLPVPPAAIGRPASNKRGKLA